MQWLCVEIYRVRCVYPWESIWELLNSAAYKMERGKLTYGLPDNDGSIQEHEYFFDMAEDGNPDGTPAEFMYAERPSKLNVVTATESGLTKRVRSASIYWTDGQDGSVIVSAGEKYYYYSLRIGSAKGTTTNNMVFYDALESYHPGDGE